jgi:D-alanyl-D-alanine carboxypeptidase
MPASAWTPRVIGTWKMTNRNGTEASPGLRSVAFIVAGTVAILSISADPASARRRHHRHHSTHAVHVSHKARPVQVARSSYSPPYASIVVDANTGEVLQATQADGPRHPASLTKIMTLYLLFEQLEAGRLNLNTALPVSAHASVQAPTKLGLKPGQTIPVETAIKALVTRSANDAAVVIAEALGGSESDFAGMMTQKARALGMSRTVYVNASGLPDDDQVTTARDQATLGRAIQERFPRYYRYFSLESFEYRGHTIRNHNHLLGKIDGVDGIKTGYTRDSGFNLVTSMWRGRRHVVAVVLGGRSAGSRDAQMRELLADNILLASTTRGAPTLAKAPAEVARVADERDPTPPARPLTLHKLAKVEALSSGENEPVATAFHVTPTPGSTDPIRPLLVKTVSIKPSPKAVKSNGPKFVSVPAPSPRPNTAAPIKTANAASDDGHRSAPHRASPPEKSLRGGWMIQVGAFGAEREARHRLDAAKNRAKRLLGDADPFTEPVTKGEKTIYRARFAGLDKHQAEAACRTLKRNEIACMALKN